MKNKIFLRIVSLIMAAGVMLTVGGCKKNNSDSGTTDASGNSVQAVVDGKGNAVQPSVDEKASTAIVKYTKVNSDGKEEKPQPCSRSTAPLSISSQWAQRSIRSTRPTVRKTALSIMP